MSCVRVGTCMRALAWTPGRGESPPKGASKAPRGGRARLPRPLWPSCSSSAHRLPLRRLPRPPSRSPSPSPWPQIALQPMPYPQVRGDPGPGGGAGGTRSWRAQRHAATRPSQQSARVLRSLEEAAAAPAATHAVRAVLCCAARPQGHPAAYPPQAVVVSAPASLPVLAHICVRRALSHLAVHKPFPPPSRTAAAQGVPLAAGAAGYPPQPYPQAYPYPYPTQGPYAAPPGTWPQAPPQYTQPPQQQPPPPQQPTFQAPEMTTATVLTQGHVSSTAPQPPPTGASSWKGSS